MEKDDLDLNWGPPGFSDGPANVDRKPDKLSLLLRRLSRYGREEMEMKLDAISTTLDSLDDPNAGSEHVDETSRSPSQDELAQVCPPWSAFAADLPRRLELLNEIKNAPFRKLDMTWERMNEKDVTPHVWAAFQVAPIESLEDLLRQIREGFFVWEHMDMILRRCRDDLWRLIKLCHSGVVPELELVEESESSSEYTSSSESDREALDTPPPESPPGTPRLVPTVIPVKDAKTRTMERDGGVCAVTGTPDADACHVFPFPGIRRVDTACDDLRMVREFWGYGLFEKFTEALRRGAEHLDSPKNMVSLNHSVCQLWDRAHATLEPISSFDDDMNKDDDGDDGLILRLRWRSLPQVRRLGKRKRPFKWRNDLAQDPMEVLACLDGRENDPLGLFHTKTHRPILDGHELVVKAEGKEERPDVWLWRLRHMTTCMAALVAAATPEGVGEEDSELDDMDRQRLLRMWLEKTES